MNSRFVLIILIVFIQSCSTYNKEIVVSKNVNENSNLEGSWKLSKYMDDGEAVWKSYKPEIIYQKHLTPTHFTWFKFNRETDLLEGAGGGSYKYDESTYTEYIDFYYPPGSTLIGQAIPFDVKINNKTWFHTGYTRDLEFDPESGELLIVDTTKIEEQWVKIDGKQEGKNSVLLGTWDLISYKMDPIDSTYSEYPDFIGYMKLITPSHFTWIKYNIDNAGGEVMGLGSGTWFTHEDNYLEHIDVMYPSGSNQLNTVLTFNMRMEDNYWHHSGYIKRIEFGEKGKLSAVDSSKIDEIWEKFQIQEY
jgi:hypothetical protein